MVYMFIHKKKDPKDPKDNNPPDAKDDVAGKVPGHATSQIAGSTILGNDTDPDGDAFDIVSVQNTSELGATITFVNGVITYDPTTSTQIQNLPAGQTITDKVTYTIRDEHGGTDTATIFYTVTSPKDKDGNNPPVANDDIAGNVSGSQANDLSTTVILQNDNDPDGDDISIIAVDNTSALGATVVLIDTNNDGTPDTVRYNPATSTQIQNLPAGQTLTDTITYTISDGKGGTDTATITYTVMSPNDPVGGDNPPDAVNDTVGDVKADASKDTLITTILANDSDPDAGDTITLKSVNGPSVNGATVTLVDTNNDGTPDSVRYDPSSSTVIQNLPVGQTLTDSVTYTIEDSTGKTDTATIFFNVMGTKVVDPNNNPPVAVDDLAGTDIPINSTTSTTSTFILGNDSDPDAGDSISIQSVATTSALGASVSFVNGQVVYDPTASSNIQTIVANLPAGQTVTDTVEYTIVDESGATDTAIIRYTINGQGTGTQNPPDALSDDLGKLKPDEISTQGFATILANDTDVDGDAINVTAVNPTSTLGASVTLVDTNNDGTPDSVRYDPSGSTTIQNLQPGQTVTDTVVYTITDATGRTDQATLFYTVHKPDGNTKNDPDALSDDLGMLEKDDIQTTGFATILANDTDIDGDAINVTAVNSTSTLGATVTLVDTNNDGTLDSVRYDPSSSTILQNLQQGESRTDSVVYTITDEDGNTDQATLFYTVKHGDINPGNTVDAVDDIGGSLNANETQGTPLATFLANDTDAEGDTFQLQSIDSTSSLGATVTLVNGVVTYDPSSSSTLQNLPVGQTLTDTVTYTIIDARGATDTAIITYTVTGKPVTGTNNPPVAVDDDRGTVSSTTSNSTNQSIILSNDSDLEDSQAELQITNVNATSVLGATVSFVNGEVVYNPQSSANIQAILNNLPVGQTITDAVEYTITDTDGNTDTAVIRYTLQGRNDTGGTGNPPVAVDDDRGTVSSTTSNSTNQSIILGNDSDVEDTQAELQITNVDPTSALGASVSFVNGQVVYDPSGSANIQTILNNLPTNQTITDTVEYTITDTDGNTDTAVISYTLQGRNDNGGTGNPPVAVDDAIGTVPSNVSTSTNQSVILSNDTDIDLNDDPAIQSVESTSALGAAVSFVNGQVVYNPQNSANIQTILDNLPSNQTIVDTVEYTIIDKDGNTDTATISYTLQGRNTGSVGNDPDALSDDLGKLKPDEISTQGFATILANDTDVDGDAINVTAVNPTSTLGASVTLVDTNNDGTPDSVRYDPSGSTTIQNLQPGQTVTDTVVYTITDATGRTDQATLFYTVHKPDGNTKNDPDALSDDLGMLEKDDIQTTGFATILANDTDIDGDAINVTAVNSTSTLGATVTLVDTNNDGTLDSVRYDPSSSTILQNLQQGESRTDSVVYTITDEDGNTDQATLFYTVKHGDINPGNTVDAVDDIGGSLNANETQGTPLATFLANDTDAEGDTFQLQSIDSTSSLGATVTLVNGVVTYDPSSSSTLQNLPVGQTLTDTVTYTIIDARGATDTATITYKVTGTKPVDPNDGLDAVNDNLGAVPINATTTNPVSTILVNDSDSDNDPLTVTQIDNTSALGATVTPVIVNGVITSFTYNPTGSQAIQNLPQGVTVQDTFSYTITDGNGNFDTATVSYTITGTKPDGNNIDAVDDFIGLVPGSSLTTSTVATILANDSDPENDPITVTSIDATSALGSSITFVDTDNDGQVDQFIYNPATSTQIQNLPAGQVLVDTITYTITDGNGNFDTATVRYVVKSPNDINTGPPDAIDDDRGVVPINQTNATTAATILSNDSDPDGDTLTITNVDSTSALGANVTFVNGVVTYDPTGSSVIQNLPQGTTVTDTVTYTITDGNGGFDTATISYTITGTKPPQGNDPDALSDDLGKLKPDEISTQGFATILANDTDVDGDAINVTAVNPTSTLGASVTLVDTNNDGTPDSVRYDPSGSTTIQNLQPGQTVTDTVVYTITDATGRTDQATLFYTVHKPDGNTKNDPDALSDDLGMLEKDDIQTTGFATILANDTDIDGDAINVTAVNSTSTLGATVTLVDTNNDGTLDSVRYDPSSSTILQNLQQGESRTDSVVYTITDEDGNTDQATLFYTVKHGDINPGNTVDAVDDIGGSLNANETQGTPLATFLANDTDAEGDTFQLQSIDSTSSLGATVTLVNGVVTYDPSSSSTLQNLPVGQTLTDTVTYTIIDARGATDTATITYKVTGTKPVDPIENDPDALSDDLGMLQKDETQTTGFATILANDTDVDGDVINVTAVNPTSSLGATVTLVDTNNDGVPDSVKYDPSTSTTIQNLQPGQSVTDSVIYTITDETGRTDQATLFYTVKEPDPAEGSPPVAVDDNIGTVPSNGTTSTDGSVILANDTDIDLNDDPVIQSVDGQSNLGATVSFVNGQVVYDPTSSANIQAILANLPANQSITDAVDYTIVDKDGNTDTATIIYTLQGRNTDTNTVDAVDDDLGMVEGDQLTTNTIATILANDTDAEGDTFSVTSIDATSSLGAAITFADTNNDGQVDQFTYDPTNVAQIQNLPAGQTLIDTITYTIVDARGATDTATITYTVKSPNGDPVKNPPDALSDDLGTIEKTDTKDTDFATILANDTDVDGDAINVTAVNPTSNLGATVTLVDTNNDGTPDTVRYNPSTSTAIQNLQPGESLTDSVIYTITDEDGNTDQATLFYTISGGDVDPTNSVDAVDDFIGLVPGGSNTTSAVADILANDSDPENDPIVVTNIDATSALGSTITFVDTNNDGQVDEFIYNPSTSQQIQNLPAGEVLVDTITYTITDGQGNFDTATVRYVVQSPNPIDPTNSVNAIDDNGGSLEADETITNTVDSILANDTDAEGDNFTLQSIEPTSNLGATVTLVNGVVTYDPSSSPTLQNLPAGQTLTDTVTYTIVDDRGAVDTATITYTITGTNTGDPNSVDAVDDFIGLVPGGSNTTSAVADILANDSDPENDPIVVTNIDATSALGSTITFVDTNNDGQVDEFIYNPSTSQQIQNLPAGEVLVDTITYTITDGQGNFDTATVRYVVQSPNPGGGDNPPDALSDDLGMVKGDEMKVSTFATILANDTDVDGDQINVTAVEPTSNLGATVALVDTDNDGTPDSVKYDPSTSAAIQNLPAGESITDSVVYTITDEDGNTDQATLFYTVESPNTVDPVNNPPDAVNDDQGTVPGDATTTTTAADILGNDSDPDGDDLTITDISTTSTLGATITFVNGEVVYDPSTSTIIQNLPSDQMVTDVVEYTISDGKGGFDTAIITYNVMGGGGTGNGNPPIALSDDLGETGADTVNVTDFGTILSNDTDPDGDQITVTAVNPTSTLGSTVTLVDTNNDGTPDSVSFDPASSSVIQNLQPGESVTDSVIYTIVDENGNTDQATLFYTVTAPETGKGTPPDAIDDDQGTVPGDDTTTVTLAEILTNDSDADGDPLSVTNIDTTSDLGASISFADTNGDGLVDEFIYDPSTSTAIQNLAPGETVTDTITYTITDGKDGFDTATVSFTVTGPDAGNNDPDAVKDDLGKVAGDEVTTTDVADILGNDSDPDGDDLEVISLDGQSELGSTVTPIIVNGVIQSFTFDPSTSDAIQHLPAGETITDTITYTISDGKGGTDTAEICFTVMSPNVDDNSVNAEDDHFTVWNDETSDGSTTILLANDNDPEGDEFAVTAADATSSLGATISLVDTDGNGIFDKIAYDPTTSSQLSDLKYGECVTDSFTYTITDEKGATDTATVFLTVEGSYQDNGWCKVIETSCWGGSWGNWKDLFNKDFVHEDSNDGMHWKDAFDMMRGDHNDGKGHHYDYADHGKDIYDDAKDCVDDSHWDRYDGNNNHDC